MTKKRFFTLMIALFSFVALDGYAQPGGGGPRGGGPGGRGHGGSSTVDLVASSGLFSFNINEGIEAAKLNDKKVVSEVISLYSVYQKAVNNTAAECSADIKALRVAERTVEASQKRGDYFAVSDVMKSVRGNMRNIKSRMTVAHLALKADIGKILDPKQRKRWDAYYNKLCRESGFRIDARRNKDANVVGGSIRP